MTIQFNKYQGTGNDFIIMTPAMIVGQNKMTQKDVRNLCDRNFGIGADGLIIIKERDGYDFEMEYYNSDGNVSTMCGNGGRCAVAFAKRHNLINDDANFIAIDGPHSAKIIGEKIALQMQNVNEIITKETYYQLNTGSPHYVAFVDDVDDINVAQEGALIRNSPLFKEDGINVNFVQVQNDKSLFVRTYERGVEDETLSCGTGVTAAALAQMLRVGGNQINVQTLGGDLVVKAIHDNNSYNEITLIGAAEFVFEGTINI